MVIERMTAKKVPIREVIAGEWIPVEGMEPSYVLTRYNDKLSRVRLLGTVVAKFIAEDENFASITLDDGTETIRGKTFKTARPINSTEIGELIDLIGKVREYNDEIYVVVESIHKIIDPNLELLRKLELNNLFKDKKVVSITKSEIKDEKENIRQNVLKEIESSPEGIEYKVLIEKMGGDESAVEKVVDEILQEGICYEPTPGKIKKI